MATRGLSVGLVGVAAMAVAALALSPRALALSSSCNWGGGPDTLVFAGDDDERTRTVLGRSSSEKVAFRTADIVEPLEVTANCGPAAGGWTSFTGTYGVLDDRIRFDGRGLEKKYRNPLAASTMVTVDGGGGDDQLRGHPGVDDLTGGGGEDLLIAGGGQDVIDADVDLSADKDEVMAGPGADEINADDDARDEIDCGTGVDFVVADNLDQVVGCEVVIT